MELIRRLRIVLGESTRQYEILLVNDGSRDSSWQQIEDLMARYTEVRGLDLLRNYGQHNALLAGIREARNQVIVTLDDDLQHPPEEIPKLLAGLEDYDVVYGTPEHEQHGLWRDVASHFTKLALQATLGAETAGKVGPFRAFRTETREAFGHYSNPFVNIDVLLTWGAARFAAVQVRHESRQVGKSNYTFLKLVNHAFNMVTGFSTLPLQLASYVGFSFTLLGLVLLAYVIAIYLINGGSVPGFPFLASVISLFSGAQLFALGIMGEYLARIHQRTSDKPPFVVRQSRSHDQLRPPTWLPITVSGEPGERAEPGS